MGYGLADIEATNLLCNGVVSCRFPSCLVTIALLSNTSFFRWLMSAPRIQRKCVAIFIIEMFAILHSECNLIKNTFVALAPTTVLIRRYCLIATRRIALHNSRLTTHDLLPAHQ